MSMPLNTIWFVIVGVLIAGYAVLDGFDLGVGILHLFVKGDEERRLSINSIGPVWDGNEVWLVTAGGALFAAFPEAYASAFSGFYTAFMLLLLMLIGRAVAIEFRSKHASARWRQAWDVVFSAASFGAALLMGVAFGNIISGVPIDSARNVTASLLDLLHPYAVLVGLTTIALFALHGGNYLVLKTDGEMQARVRSWIRPLVIAFTLAYVVVTMATLLYQPHMVTRIQARPALFALPVAAMLTVANIPREIFHGREFRAFVSSSLTIVFLLALVGLGLYPMLLRSNVDLTRSLTIDNAASSQKTLEIMLVIAAIGVPVVLAYTTIIYWIFRGKVRLGSHSY
jgi:cytochrome bd ubiquinol oxidase subunit II